MRASRQPFDTALSPAKRVAAKSDIIFARLNPAALATRQASQCELWINTTAVTGLGVKFPDPVFVRVTKVLK